jgi:hypothetical protein
MKNKFLLTIYEKVIQEHAPKPACLNEQKRRKQAAGTPITCTRALCTPLGMLICYRSLPQWYQGRRNLQVLVTSKVYINKLLDNFKYHENTILVTV